MLSSLVGVALAANAPTAPASFCGATNPADAYPPSSAHIAISITLVPLGATAVVTGSGYARSGQPGAGSAITLTLCSDPLALGSATLRPDGTFSRTITMPDNARTGSHRIFARGADGKGGILVQATGLTVPATISGGTSSGITGGSASGSTSGSGSALPFTGAEIGALVGFALVMTGTGVLLVRAGRRRRMAV